MLMVMSHHLLGAGNWTWVLYNRGSALNYWPISPILPPSLPHLLKPWFKKAQSCQFSFCFAFCLQSTKVAVIKWETSKFRVCKKGALLSTQVDVSTALPKFPRWLLALGYWALLAVAFRSWQIYVGIVSRYELVSREKEGKIHEKNLTL